MRFAFFLALFLFIPRLAVAVDETALKRLDTGDDSRGWNAVGRLNIGDKGFCTGTLIAPQLVLTAAHCLFDKDAGTKIDPSEIRFLAGWRNGRAEAYRGVRRAVVPPDYTYVAVNRLDRVAHDIALLQLDQPIRLPSITPFDTDTSASQGDAVGVVSYAKDREDAPSLQEVCHVLGRQPGVLVLSCNVDFGSSGAPVFSARAGTSRIISVVSAKAEVDGKKVALGVALDQPLAELMTALDQSDPAFLHVGTTARRLSAGAKFVRP